MCDRARLCRDEPRCPQALSAQRFSGHHLTLIEGDLTGGHVVHGTDHDQVAALHESPDDWATIDDVLHGLVDVLMRTACTYSLFCEVRGPFTSSPTA